MTARFQNLALFAILTLGLSLRLWGIHFGLPFQYHADEPIVVNHALAYGTGDLNPHFFKIPPLASYLLFGFYGIYFLAGSAAGIFHSVRDFEVLFYRDPSSFYLIGRIILGALCGTAGIYCLYRLALRLAGKRIALISAFLLSVCFLHVRDSHYIYPDMPLNLILISSFFIFIRLAESGGLRWHAYSGVLIGLAVAMKYNGVALAVPYLAAAFGRDRKLNFAACAMAGTVSLIVFSALNPFWIFDARTFFAEIHQQSQAQTGTGLLHLMEYSMPGAVGWPLLIAGAAGVLQALSDRKEQGHQPILAWFVLGYFILLWKAGEHYDRYVLPVLPFWLFFAALFLDKFSKRFTGGRTLGLAVLVLAAALPPLAKSIYFDRLMSQKDTRTLAREWIEKEIPPGSVIAVDWDFYMPRLSFDRIQLEEKKAQVQAGGEGLSGAQARKLDYLLGNSSGPSYRLYFLSSNPENSRTLFSRPVVAFDPAALREKGVQYVLRARVPRPALDQTFWPELEKQAALVKTWTPYKALERMLPFDDQPLTGGPFLWTELSARERNGMPIELYKLQP